VQVGTATFADPYAMTGIIDGLEAYLAQTGTDDVNKLIGGVEPYAGGIL
jgi:dihydroorotate dehydrogenase (NAD+) catalytic subunit